MRHPFTGEPIHSFRIADGAIATSGVTRRAWLRPDGRLGHHLIDPARGEPAWTGLLQATALAPPSNGDVTADDWEGLRTLYAQRARSATFAADWDAAVAAALGALEEELVHRVRHGVEKPVFYAGQQVGSMRQYSDALAMFILKARRPEVYGRVVAERALAAEAGAGDEPSQDEARAEVLRRLARLGDG